MRVKRQAAVDQCAGDIARRWIGKSHRHVGVAIMLFVEGFINIPPYTKIKGQLAGNFPIILTKK